MRQGLTVSVTWMIQSKEVNMEYIIFLTYRCNLNCSYCFASNVVFDNNSAKYSLSDDKSNQIISFIKRDILKRKSKDNSIVFFGGEPTLVPHVIDYIIRETSDLNLKYSIYTNGLLLDRIPKYILSKLDTILIAIDGDKAVHEIYKPVGSYDKILRNVRSIRNEFQGELIARITMEEKTDIYKSVTNLLDDFDFVHWQIVNKPYFNDPKFLLASYAVNIDKLCDFWIDALANGIIYGIVPFIEIVSYLLTGIESGHESFWCGCGKEVMAIDVQGNIYQCDEYINRPDMILSSIEKQNVNLNYRPHTEIFEDCKKCSISSICLGRCKKSLETLSPEQLRIYCSLTHMLISKLDSQIDTIREIITQNQWEMDCFPHSIYNTEVIP